jgi:hypothetical protein
MFFLRPEIKIFAVRLLPMFSDACIRSRPGSAAGRVTGRFIGPVTGGRLLAGEEMGKKKPDGL